MRQIVHVTRVEALAGFRLSLAFSDGRGGIGDCSDILAVRGVMTQPLQAPEMFSRVFLQMGVPTWPNGFDLDAIRLYEDMDAAGLLGLLPTASKTAAQ